MNNEIQKFDFKGAPLRTLTDKAGEPWFVAKDVCAILEISNPSDALKRLDDDERSRFNLGRQGETNIVNEAGLYVLVLGSRKPEAHEFKRWVTHEVLPQIRKTGGYIPTSESDSDEDIMARAVLVAQKTIERKNQQLQSKAAQIKELEPKARFADAVAASDGTCLVGELAKMLRQNGMDIGQNRLFRLLQADGYLGKSGSNRNVPTQRAMDLGLFRIKETTVTHADGHTTVSRTPKVTGKGQLFHRPVLGSRSAVVGSGCVMSETWLPACISLTAGLFSLSLALLRILVDLDPIGWILSLGECQESGKADAVGDVQITIIPVSNVRTGISSELANAVSFPVSDDAAVPGATHESNRNGTRGASNASAASSNGGVSL